MKHGTNAAAVIIDSETTVRRWISSAKGCEPSKFNLKDIRKIME